MSSEIIPLRNFEISSLASAVVACADVEMYFTSYASRYFEISII